MKTITKKVFVSNKTIRLLSEGRTCIPAIKLTHWLEFPNEIEITFKAPERKAEFTESEIREVLVNYKNIADWHNKIERSIDKAFKNK